MQSNRTRVLVALGSIAAIVALLIVFAGSGDEEQTTVAQPATTSAGGSTTDEAGGKQEKPKKPAKPAKPQFETIVIKGGQPEGGVKDLSYKSGDTVRIEVSSDVADEIHVHGYDISTDVEAGGKAKVEFVADIEGVFEVELESARRADRPAHRRAVRANLERLVRIGCPAAAAAIVAVAAAGLAFPGSAEAHGLIGRGDLPLPEWLLGWGASLLLIGSFAGLVVLWPEPRLEGDTWRPAEGRFGSSFSALLRSPATGAFLGLLSVGLLALVIYSGLAGTEAPDRNFSVTFVFVTFWLGLVVLSVLFGDALPAAQSMARDRSRRLRRVRPDRRTAGAGAARLSGAPRPLAGGDRPARLPLVRARLGPERLCRGRRLTARRRGRRLRLLGDHLRRHGAVRRRSLDRPRRDLLRLLRNVRQPLGLRGARRADRAPPPLRGRQGLGGSDPRLAGDRLDRDRRDQLRRRPGGRAEGRDRRAPSGPSPTPASRRSAPCG